MPKNEKQTLKVGGATVFWTVGGKTHVDKFKAGLDALGYGHIAPERTAATSTLRDALNWVLGDAQTLVRPLKTKDGFAVVLEERRDDGNDYRTDVTARVDKAERVTVTGASNETEDEIRKAFDEFKDLLRPSQVTSVLTRVVEGLSGVTLRPQGGIYWLPAAKLDEWEALGSAVESAGEGNLVYTVRNVIDAAAVRAVLDALKDEAEGAASVIQQEIEQGELGARALNTRVDRARSLTAKIGEYEKLLGTTLGDLKATVEKAETAAAAAAILASAVDAADDSDQASLEVHNAAA